MINPTGPFGNFEFREEDTKIRNPVRPGVESVAIHEARKPPVRRLIIGEALSVRACEIGRKTYTIRAREHDGHHVQRCSFAEYRTARFKLPRRPRTAGIPRIHVVR